MSESRQPGEILETLKVGRHYELLIERGKLGTGAALVLRLKHVAADGTVGFRSGLHIPVKHLPDLVRLLVRAQHDFAVNGRREHEQVQPATVDAADESLWPKP